MIQAICLGQTEMLNSQYLFEKTFVTPANYSQEEKLRTFMNYQTSSGRQRAGKEHMYSLAANYKINEKSLVGINVVNSKFGQESSLFGYMNYTYNLKMTENSFLSNGFGFGFQQYRLDMTGEQGVDPNDPLEGQNIYSSKFDFRIGTTAVINRRTYFGVAFDNVLSRYNNQNENDVNYLPVSFRRINMTFMAGNKHKLDSDFDLHYEGLYTYNFGGLSTLDLNTGVVIGGLVGAGISYRRYIRSEESEILSSGVVRPFITLKLNKNRNDFKFNYAYGFAPSRMNMVGLTTHEFGFVYAIK